MKELRQFVDELRNVNELEDIWHPVDVRDVATLVDQSSPALMFHNVIGYTCPVVSGLLSTRRRVELSLGCETAELAERLRKAMDAPIDPVIVGNSDDWAFVQEMSDVDLFALPVPIFSQFDGGPTITAGVTLAQDPTYGLNAGTYRFQVKEKNLTGIDIVTPNNLRRLAENALLSNSPVPVSINIGTSPLNLIASLYKAPLGVNELGIAGSIQGSAVQLGRCKTVDVPYLKDSEIVLEAEIMPTGWTKPEGRFGEFTGLMGSVHFNPHVRVKAVSYRKNAIYYALHMPWENIWIKEHGFQAMLERVLKEANIEVTAINVTPGGRCHWHAVISIRKHPGDARNAITAALSVGDFKHVVIVDDDIDVFNADEVEWAIATRVQADQDIVILSGMRSKPLDPSLTPTLGVPTTSKCGIDATIPDGVPPERYHRISYPHAKSVKLSDFSPNTKTGSKAEENSTSKETVDLTGVIKIILELLTREPLYFVDLADQIQGVDFSMIARAMGDLHVNQKIDQDSEGRYVLIANRKTT